MTHENDLNDRSFFFEIDKEKLTNEHSQSNDNADSSTCGITWRDISLCVEA